MEAIKGASERALAGLQKLGDDLQQRFVDFGESPEAAELQKALETYRDKLREAGSESTERLRDEAQKLREKADEMGRALEEKGLDERARELRDEVESILENGGP